MCSPPKEEEVVPSRPTMTRRGSSSVSKRQRQRVSAFVVDTATAAFVAHYLYNNPSYLNPWSLPSAGAWIAGFFAVRFGVLFYDHVVVQVVERCFRSGVLPTREAGAPPVRYVALDGKSVAYLAINSLNEYAFVMRLTRYLWSGGYQELLPWRPDGLNPGNTLLALGVMFVSMDLLYAPLHHVLHLPAFYPLVHKHHHRQHFPARGYLDAGNEHPIEHMIGVMCTWFAVHSAEVFVPTLRLLLAKMSGSYAGDEWTRGGGVHAATVLVFFQFHAALACLNHSPYDVNFSLPFAGSSCVFGGAQSKVVGWLDDVPVVGRAVRRFGTGQWFRYSVGHHEMHHRKFNYNYGQYCMLYDRLMGTFLGYEGPKRVSELAKEKSK